MYTPVTPHPVVPEAQQERSGLARLWYQLGPGSRRRQRLARAEAQRLVALQYRWQEACLHVGLALMIYTPSGVVASWSPGSSGPTPATPSRSPCSSGRGSRRRTSSRRRSGLCPRSASAGCGSSSAATLG